MHMFNRMIRSHVAPLIYNYVTMDTLRLLILRFYLSTAGCTTSGWEAILQKPVCQMGDVMMPAFPVLGTAVPGGLEVQRYSLDSIVSVKPA